MMRAIVEFRAQPHHVEPFRTGSQLRGTKVAYVAGDPSIKFAERRSSASRSGRGPLP
ncbi:MAG TPA: hypothetical protein VFL28_04705 [bacterium]|nr:hypothetical protein [bacterium]